MPMREEERDQHSTNWSVRREVELVKRQLRKLKLGMTSILEEKAKALSTLQHAHSKIQSVSATAEALTNQLQTADEDRVLVELARIEAMQEAAQIQALQQKESAEFSFAREGIQKKVEKLRREIDASKELELQLAVTLADVSLLQNQVKAFKDMDTTCQLDVAGGSETSQYLLVSITQELEATKEELASVREEGFQFMSSMDVVRNELKHVTGEIARLKKTGDKADSKAKNLNSKLLRAKSKYEAASAAEEKTRSILKNLSLTLEQLHTEAHMSKKEKALISEETGIIKAEIQNTESATSTCEERLQASMHKLEDVKSSEALALHKLKSLIENTLQARAFAPRQNSTITISKFEYEYLMGRAVGAEEIADKKVAAAQAWIEALKASEKEVLMKVEIAHRNVREIKMEEERKLRGSERPLPAKRRVESDSNILGQKQKKITDEGQNLHSPCIRKSLKYGGKSTPSSCGQAKLCKSASPATRRSTPVIIKKKKVIPNLAKFFGRKKTSKDV